MRTTKEERADLRARCRAGVIAITTDAALVAALLDDVEELEAMADLAARRWAIAASEASGLRSELAAARAAMPTNDDIDALREFYRGIATREEGDRARAWLCRLFAYHAAHPAASPAAEVPKLCTACQGDGMGPYDRQPYYPGSRPIPCHACKGTGLAGGGGHE